MIKTLGTVRQLECDRKWNFTISLPAGIHNATVPNFNIIGQCEADILMIQSIFVNRFSGWQFCSPHLSRVGGSYLYREFGEEIKTPSTLPSQSVTLYRFSFKPPHCLPLKKSCGRPLLLVTPSLTVAGALNKN